MKIKTVALVKGIPNARIVIGAFSIDPDGYLVETEDKDKS